MKSIQMRPRITNQVMSRWLGLSFLGLMSITLISYLNVSEHMSELYQSLQSPLAKNRLFNFTLVSLLIPALGYIPYLLYKQKSKADKLRLKLASDLHDELGSILNTVSIYTDLALVKGEERYLLKIKESTQEAITGIRNIIWQLDDNDTSFTNLVSRINNFASFLCQVKKIHFKVDIAKESFLYKLEEAEKANLYMIVKEAINNSIKYAEPKEIRVSIDLENGKPVIEISDDGKGYNESDCSMGNGIRNMKTRALNIRYKFSIKSSAGTVIELRKK